MGKCIKLEENTGENIFDLQFNSVQSLSHFQLFATPWTIYSLWNFSGRNTGEDSFPFSRGSSQPRDLTQISHTTGGSLLAELPGKLCQIYMQQIFHSLAFLFLNSIFLRAKFLTLIKFNLSIFFFHVHVYLCPIRAILSFLPTQWT